MIRKIFGLLLITLSFQQLNCVPFPNDYKEFRKLSVDEQKKKFSTLSLDKQVDYLTYCRVGNMCEGFEINLIAAQGQKVISLLLNRMENSSDIDKYTIACVFEKINSDYYVLNESDNKIRLKKIADDMKDPIWRDMTQKAILKIAH